jgi:hypothetical protein
MTNDAQRKATKTYVERLQARGGRKVSVWISPNVAPLLAALVPRYGTAKAVIEAAIRALAKNDKQV